MNRAGALRLTACGILGLGAALLVAALLLSTYTSTRITKIPLDIDTTLISDGTGTALDSASLSGDHLVVNQNVPLVSQQQDHQDPARHRYHVDERRQRHRTRLGVLVR